MDPMNQSCKQFVQELSSPNPTPGGGGACALVGAAGAALGHMMGSLAIGKPRYAAAQEELTRLCAQTQQVQQALLALAERDEEAFAPLSAAYKMPAGTDEEKAAKDAALQSALIEATEAPLEIMRQCAAAIGLIQEFALKGSVMALSDAGVGALFCRAALTGASLSVFANTRMMADREKADSLEKEAHRLLSRWEGEAERIARYVADSLQDY